MAQKGLADDGGDTGPGDEVKCHRLMQSHYLQVMELVDPANFSSLNKKPLPLELEYKMEMNEQILSMEFCRFPNVAHPVLCVGTGYNFGEDYVCRGRIHVFFLDGQSKEPVFVKRLKGPVFTMKGNVFEEDYFMYSFGHKLYVNRWSSDQFQLITYRDAGFCIMSLATMKNFLILGDIHKGVDFLRLYTDRRDGAVKRLERL